MRRRRPTRRAAGAPARCPGAAVTFGEPAGTPPGQRDQVGVRLDADHRAAAVGREARQVEAGAAAEVEERRGRPRTRCARIAASIAPSGSAARFSISYVAGWCQMFGLGTAPSGAVPAQAQSRTSPFGVWNCAAMMPGRAVRGDPVDLDVLERGLDGLAEPLADPLRVAGDLQAGQGEAASAPGARVHASAGDSHCTKNGSCGSAIRPLTPICFHAARCRRGGAGCRRPPRGRAAARPR